MKRIILTLILIFQAVSCTIVIDKSAVDAAKTLAPTIPTSTINIPSIPTVSSLAINSGMTITWSTTSGATSYNLYYGSLSGIYLNSVPNVTSPYTITGLTNGINYYVVVTAVNSAGESSFSNEVASIPGMVDNMNGTISVASTGLTWMKCAQVDALGNNAYNSANNDCSNGVPSKLQLCNVLAGCQDIWGTITGKMEISEVVMTANGTYSEVYFTCKLSKFAGGGWRLPTMAEFEAFTPLYDPNLWSIPNDFYWSITGFRALTQYGTQQAAYNLINGSWTTPADIVGFPAHAICVR